MKPFEGWKPTDPNAQYKLTIRLKHGSASITGDKDLCLHMYTVFGEPKDNWELCQVIKNTSGEWFKGSGEDNLEKKYQKDRFLAGMFIGGFLTALLAFATTMLNIGESRIKAEAVRTDAIKRGYAEYRVGKEGQAEWHWKNDPTEAEVEKK